MTRWLLIRTEVKSHRKELLEKYIPSISPPVKQNLFLVHVQLDYLEKQESLSSPSLYLV